MPRPRRVRRRLIHAQINSIDVPEMFRIACAKRLRMFYRRRRYERVAHFHAMA